MKVEDMTRKPLKESLGESSPNSTSSTYRSNDSYCEDEEDDLSDYEHSPMKGETEGKKKIYPDIPDFRNESLCPESKKTVKKRSSKMNSPSQTNFDTSTSSSNTSRNSEDHSNLKFWLIGVVCVIVIVSLIIGITYFVYFKGDSQQRSDRKSDSITNQLKTQFPNQPRITYTIIRKALKNILDNGSNPTCPAILLFLSSKGAEELTDCFSRFLASSIDNKFLHIKADEASISKLNLDEKIKSTFNDDNLNVLLLSTIDSLSGEVASILHNYCDHENALFKKSVILMTVSSIQKISLSVDSKTADRYAYDLLRGAWNDEYEDGLDSLLSRVAVNVAPIMPGMSPSKCVVH